MGIIIIFFFIITIFLNYFNLVKTDLNISKKILSKVDITEPKFTINNESKKIYITAKEGSFLNEDEILLKDNVRFNSNDFRIESEIVIFNRNKQTAKSKTKSKFISDNTIISSDGFNIYDNGEKIIFHGSANIILK